MKFLRMKPGHGEVLLAEGDPSVQEDEERLVEEFRRQLDEGMWAAVPVTNSRAAGGARRRWSRSTPTSRPDVRARDLLPARLRRLTRSGRCCSRSWPSP